MVATTDYDVLTLALCPLLGTWLIAGSVREYFRSRASSKWSDTVVMTSLGVLLILLSVYRWTRTIGL
jgi:hypothetical protein